MRPVDGPVGVRAGNAPPSRESEEGELELVVLVFDFIDWFRLEGRLTMLG